MLTIILPSIFVVCVCSLYFKYQKSSKFLEFNQEILSCDVNVEDVKHGKYKDRSYLPFRYPYQQTMALVKLDMNHWGMINEQYFMFHKEKKEIFNNFEKEKLSKNNFYKSLEDDITKTALLELRDFVMNHYSQRFPNLFEFRTKNNKRIFVNKLLEEEYEFQEMDPLEVVTRIAMEDFYVCTKEENDDQFKCAAASVAFGGGGFPIIPIVGQYMDEIHKPVPYYESKLRKSMNKWFDKFVDPVERASWHFVWDKNLDCNEVYSKLTELSEEKYCEYIKTIPFEKFEVRIEKQALIKLPKSKAIVFSNHPLFLNIVDDLYDAPMVPSILLKMLYEAPEEIIKQKHFSQIREHLKGPLEKMIEQQFEIGLIPNIDCKVRTVDGYPFRK